MLNFCLFLSILSLTYCQQRQIVSSDPKIFIFEVNKNLTFRNQELRNHVLQEFSTKYQVTQCAMECHKTARCQSFNYVTKKRICQLNDATHEEFEEDFYENNSTDYYLRDTFIIDQDAIGPCGSSPCQNDGRCLDVQSSRTGGRTYICSCKKDWQGKNCEYEADRLDWSDWETWGSCSRTCGSGFQTRRRSCVDTNTKEIKPPTECYGADVEYKACDYKQCPRWDEWGKWSPCSTYTTCGRGHKERTRKCANGGTPGVDRYCLGPTNESAICEGIQCDNAVRLADQIKYGEGRVELFHSIDNKWLQVCAENWDETAADIICKQRGFEGIQNVITDGRYDGNTTFDTVSVNCSGGEWQLQQCHREEADDCSVKAGVQCRVQGIWSLWTPWGECSVTCENGTRTRTRKCNHPPPNFNGTDCPGDDTEYKLCTMIMCPVDGIWTTWTSWSSCSVSCANGTQYRTRNCTGPFYEGKECEGDSKEIIECFPKICPVDGVWRPWSDWSECSLPCGYGSKNRSRTCNGPFYGGLECEGDLAQTEGCNSFSCPVDGMWMRWTEWQDCSVSCGGGIQNRTRECISPKHGGQACDGAASESKACETHECPVDGVWVEWSPWTDCSVTCANGTRSRNRTCTGPFYGGMNCTGESDEVEICVTASCPVDGEWQSWTNWQTCNVTCGGGGTIRTRECIGPYFGGKECKGENEEWKECGTTPCPVDGVWNNWSNWTECSQSCGTGYQTRNRTCDGPDHGGNDCVGDWDQIRDCNPNPCPVDGYWNQWSNWTACNVSCGGGNQWRIRECVEPLYGGAECLGDDLESKLCNSHECPVDGYWGEWADWSNCTLPCGNGTQTRNRTCIGPYYGGADCYGDEGEERLCNTHFCPVDGVWEEWANWTDCSRSCGRGTHTRSRLCDGPYHGGQPCEGPFTERRDCHSKNCPVDGKFLEWSAWGSCDVTCGGGIQYRNRTCDGPYFGGKNCTGDLIENQDCNTEECPVDGVWVEWTPWGDCSTTCGGGLRSRSRTCNGPFYGGANCTGPYSEETVCGTDPCPIPGEWLEWSPWSRCTVTCDGGTRFRTHECNMTSYGDLTAPCLGSSNDTEDCHTFDCDTYATTCTELGTWGLVDSTYADVQPIDSSHPPERVYCDMESEDGVGVTIIGHDKEETTNVTGFEGAGQYKVVVNYNISIRAVVAIIDLSSNCQQYLRWDCKGAVIHNPHTNAWTTYWTNRSSAEGSDPYTRSSDYFAGAAPGSGMCACGMTNSCAFANITCNCDANQDTWRFDDGNITYKNDLPILAFRAGDTGLGDGVEMGKHTIGPIRCSGSINQK